MASMEAKTFFFLNSMLSVMVLRHLKTRAKTWEDIGVGVEWCRIFGKTGRGTPRITFVKQA